MLLSFERNGVWIKAGTGKDVHTLEFGVRLMVVFILTNLLLHLTLVGSN